MTGYFHNLLRVVSLAISCSLLASCLQGPVNTPEQAVLAAKSAWEGVHEEVPWHAIFSKESVARAEPYSAVLESGKWHVIGTLREGASDMPEALINQHDGAADVFTHLTNRSTRP
jgi:hypothetical protein